MEMKKIILILIMLISIQGFTQIIPAPAEKLNPADFANKYIFSDGTAFIPQDVTVTSANEFLFNVDLSQGGLSLLYTSIIEDNINNYSLDYNDTTMIIINSSNNSFGNFCAISVTEISSTNIYKINERVGTNYIKLRVKKIVYDDTERVLKYENCNATDLQLVVYIKVLKVE